ncbi:hypothetical protein PRELSG_0602500 [Plasmodium relictum]|uniref:Uncharacterized protein n=1 Tax=Plasmodium relictum TaxID=85471 RepID=A0A1J1H622_PLARL|nr:hypothetical protein PRELSG_0602500 [Plasmodium relictum]CRG99050.1 hypothetical protein PRELSG_0602500 [Plasmodium relictum]
MNKVIVYFIAFTLLYFRSMNYKNNILVTEASQLSKECVNDDMEKKANTFPSRRRSIYQINLPEDDDKNKDISNSSKLKYNMNKNINIQNEPNFSLIADMDNMELLCKTFSNYSMEDTYGRDYIKNLNRGIFFFMYEIYYFFKSRTFEKVNKIVKRITVLNSFNFLENMSNFKEKNVNYLEYVPTSLRKMSISEFDDIHKKLIMLMQKTYIEMYIHNNNFYNLKVGTDYILDISFFLRENVFEISTMDKDPSFFKICINLLELTYKNLNELTSKDILYNIKLNNKINMFLNKEFTLVGKQAREELKKLDSALKDLHLSHLLNRNNFNIFFHSFLIKILEKSKEKAKEIANDYNSRKVFKPFVKINSSLLNFYKENLKYHTYFHFNNIETVLKKYLEEEFSKVENNLINEALQSHRRHEFLKKKLIYLIDIAKLNHNNKKILRYANMLGENYMDDIAVKEKIHSNLKNINEKLKSITEKKNIATIILKNVQHANLLLNELTNNEDFLKNIQKYLNTLILSSKSIKEKLNNSEETNCLFRLLQRKKKVILDNKFMSAYTLLFFYNYISITTI